MGSYNQFVREEEEGFDQEASPSAKKWEEQVREIRQEVETTWSLTLKELQDMERLQPPDSVRARYPFKEDLANYQGKWTTAEEGIQYLRELMVLEVIYGDQDNVSKDPDYVLYIWAMWRKVVLNAPAF
ncbi:ubiquitin carboxyl-terminal hydrolase 4 [Limosa lapponica baueri]|uniref:Ubiquitin carboxyl-terminal hydrolase 4 n=1 Tax=Limosa lapponica baueri TaxID=1758121 RepID=A0A2I0TC59_LIMLA|nr:ubiquitin carboxyl-terminal hydrolase 4 [Limosa lapponica baueri]